LVLLRTNKPERFSTVLAAHGRTRKHTSTFPFCENDAKAVHLGGDKQTGDAGILSPRTR